MCKITNMITIAILIYILYLYVYMYIIIIRELNGNKLDGTINNEFGNLKKLKTLNLNNNNLSGAVPESLFQIKSLENV